MYVKTRQEMAQFINERMNKTYQELREEQRLEVETSLAKTYLMEAHLTKDISHDKIFEFIKENFIFSKKNKKGLIEIKETEDENFFCAHIRVDRESSITLYIDSTDSRFWRIHSMDKSTQVDKLIEKFTVASMSLDRIWLPIQLLENISKLGFLYGLGLDYDRREIPDVDFIDPEAPVEYLKMQLWGNKAGKVLRILRDENAFPHETTLSKVKVKFMLDKKNKSEFSLDEIKFNGKITARGTSFQSHITLVSNLYRKYIKNVLKLENQYSLSYKLFKENKTGYSISGLPINILFGRPIKNIDRFCRRVFSSSFPFRLWGVPIKLSNRYVRVSGLDLHVGRRIDFELTPEFMRIYLPLGSCGNSVLRIFTNLQHYYDSLVEARDGNGESIFEFKS